MIYATTLSFENLHNYGELFANLLRARHQTFIDRKHWDLPHANGMEFDQYDTPASRWVAVHDDARHVLAGVRLTPTTHRCGIYTYMIRDAQRGLLDSIPNTLLYDQAPVASHIWESSRVFVSSEVAARMRFRVQSQLISEPPRFFVAAPVRVRIRSRRSWKSQTVSFDKRSSIRLTAVG